MRFTEMLLLVACALFPLLLVAGNNVGFTETVKFDIQGKRDVTSWSRVMWIVMGMMDSSVWRRLFVV